MTEAVVIAIYRDTIDALYGYASRRCGGQRHVAEDVTQEAWLRAVREWPRSGVPDNPLAWLTTVVRNLIINQARRLPPVSIDEVAPQLLEAIERDALSDTADVAQLVNQALTRLPPQEAQLIDEFHFQRSRVAELAARHGISERAIEGRLRRARERLRSELQHTLPKFEGERL